MKKILVAILAVLLLSSLSWGAWDPDVITNSTKFKYWPGYLADNFQAIETGTDAALLVTNVKVSPTAGIVDTKLATISSAGKVNATALVGLPNTPSGAGVLPVANGGTGGATAAAARVALGAAMLGNNTDITRLNNLTTPLSVAQGGTGSATQNFLDLTTNQTVTGIKNYTSSPIVPTPTTDYQASTKKYVDDSVGAITGYVDTTTNQTINGTKTFGAAVLTPYVSRVYLAGSNSLVSSTADKSFQNASWVKQKEIQLNSGAGTLRISFELKNQSEGDVAYGRIYRNGVAVGTSRSVTGNGGDQTFSEDISGWSRGDLIQVYAYISNPARTGHVLNFIVYVDNTIVDTATLN